MAATWFFTVPWDEQLGADFGVGVPGRHELSELALPIGELGASRGLRRMRRPQ
jgi:hypothetical protein